MKKIILSIILILKFLNCFSVEYDNNISLSDTDSIGRSLYEVVVLKNKICAYKNCEGFPDCVLQKGMSFNIIGECNEKYKCIFSDRIFFINKKDIRCEHNISNIINNNDTDYVKCFKSESIKFQLEYSISLTNEILKYFDKNKIIFRYANSFTENNLTVDYKFCIFNNSKKTISSFDISFSGFNKDGKIEISKENSSYVIHKHCIGDIHSNDEIEYTASNVWNYGISKTKITKLVINYNDGTSEIIKKPNAIVYTQRLVKFEKEMDILNSFRKYE